MKNISNTFYTVVILICVGLLYACTEADYGDDFKPATPPPIGDYSNSDEVAAANLSAKWSFEGNLTESKQNLNGTAHGTSFTTGFKGQAFQGSQTGYAEYPSAGTLANLKSFTVSFWMKIDTFFCCGATQLFQIENTGDFWSNLTVYFEPRDDKDSLRFRVQFNKQGNPSGSAFIETKIGKETEIIGKWVNVIAVYNGATSTYSAYLNSRKGPESKPTINGQPFGEANFANVGRLIFGTWKQKIGGGGDVWMQNFRGALDEFRIYNKALTDLEVSALYQLERQGR